MTNIIDRLPFELQSLIFHHLGPLSLCEAASTSKSWCVIALSVLEDRKNDFDRGLIFVASAIKSCIELKNINFIALKKDVLHPWLLSMPSMSAFQAFPAILQEEIRALQQLEDTPVMASGLWFGHNGAMALCRRATSMDRIYERERIVTDIFDRCLRGEMPHENRSIAFESLILGLSRLIHSGHFAFDFTERMPPSAMSIAKISSIYARDLPSIDSSFDAIRRVSYDLINAGQIERVFTFLDRADCQEGEIESYSSQIIKILDRLCLINEEGFLPKEGSWEAGHLLSDATAKLLRRHMTVFMNRLGYFFPLSNNGRCKSYWTGGRQNRNRIECTWGFRYDSIRSIFMSGDTKLATTCVLNEWNESVLPHRKEDILIYIGFCFETSLLCADRARGDDEQFKGEVSFDQYLLWVKELICLIPEEEREVFIKGFLDKRIFAQNIPQEANIKMRVMCEELLEDLRFSDAVDSSECLHCISLRK